MDSAMKLEELSGPELVNVMNEVMAEVKSRLDEGAVTKYVEREIPKSSNQQRAELIQRAREFVEGMPDRDGDISFNNEGTVILCVPEFFIKDNRVTCVLRGSSSGKVRSVGRAKCMPGDVFNEWIGKAIAAANALKIDIPQGFIDAVQPVEKVVGMVVYDVETRVMSKRKVVTAANGGFAGPGECHPNSVSALRATIIDDTNAIYESVGD